MNILITGGTGYLGSHLALDLATRGHAVTVVARAPGPGTSTAARRAEELRAAGVTLAHADLGRRGDLAKAVDPAPFQVFIHGVCSFLEPPRGESLTLVAMEELLALAARAPRLAQAIDLSNNLVLAVPGRDDFPDESFPCRPETAHGRNKLAAERMLERSGLPWLTLRIPQVYGGLGSSFDWIMVDPIRRGAFPVPCDGKNRVGLVHVEDVVQAVRLCVDAGVVRRVFNVASGERDLTLGAVFDAIAQGFGLPPPRRLPRAVALLFMGGAERWARLRGREPTMVADMVRALSENRTLATDRIRAELGFAPRFPDTRAGISSSYADVFAGRAHAFNPAGRLGAAQGVHAKQRSAHV